MSVQMERRKRKWPEAMGSGTLIVCGGESLDARVAAAAGMLRAEGDVELVDAIDGRLAEHLRGRNALLVGVGANAELISTIQEDLLEIMVIERSGAVRQAVMKFGTENLRVVGDGFVSAAASAWQAFERGAMPQPELVSGMDWMVAGREVDGLCKRLAYGALAENATVEELSRGLDGCMTTLRRWEDIGFQVSEGIETVVSEQAAMARICSLGGAKVAITESDAQFAGSVAEACARMHKCIGATYTLREKQAEVTLRGGAVGTVGLVARAFGGEGNAEHGLFVLARSALNDLMCGSLSPLQAKRALDDERRPPRYTADFTESGRTPLDAVGAW